MPRPIHEIAADIYEAWPKVNFAAAPYLDAMQSLDKIEDPYFADSGEDIVRRFLGNASAFRGEKAKALKAELRGLLMPARQVDAVEAIEQMVEQAMDVDAELVEGEPTEQSEWLVSDGAIVRLANGRTLLITVHEVI